MNSLNSRRGFLQALACASILPSSMMQAQAKTKLINEASMNQSDIGVQIYSVRDALQQNVELTFSRLAQIGFTHLECFDITQLEQQSQLAQAYGLNINSMHVLSPFLTENQQLAAKHKLMIPPSLNTVDKVIETLQRHNIKQLVLSYLFVDERENIEQYQRLAEVLQVVGEKCRVAGIQLCYHNHDFEFYPLADKKIPFEVLLKQTSAEALKFELDVFWSQFAGLNPANMINMLGERCQALHLKDLKLCQPTTLENQLQTPDAVTDNFVPLGQGHIDFTQVLLAAKKVGVQHLYIEQDHSNNIFSDLQTSFNYLKNIRLNQGT